MPILFAIVFLVLIFKCVGLVLGVCGKLLGAVLSLFGFIVSIAIGAVVFGIFSLVSVPNIVGCVGAAIIIIAAIATPIAKSQHMREIWFYVMSGGVMLKIVVMEIARIIQMF